MFVGICHIDLIIHDNRSLKGKRQVLKTIIDRVKNRFNVSIAEIGANDLWQRSRISLCAVGNDSSLVNSILDNTINFIEGLHIAEIIDHRIEIINYSYEL
ncbi:MAG: DUF503 domain-containing protein [Deltaproteobacteria bacterium]|nr:DUF503 domain-containing protein [Deltaproteobacteria bacterium]